MRTRAAPTGAATRPMRTGSTPTGTGTTPMRTGTMPVAKVLSPRARATLRACQDFDRVETACRSTRCVRRRSGARSIVVPDGPPPRRQTRLAACRPITATTVIGASPLSQGSPNRPAVRSATNSPSGTISSMAGERQQRSRTANEAAQGRATSTPIRSLRRTCRSLRVRRRGPPAVRQTPTRWTFRARHRRQMRPAAFSSPDWRQPRA